MVIFLRRANVTNVQPLDPVRAGNSSSAYLSFLIRSSIRAHCDAHCCDPVRLARGMATTACRTGDTKVAVLLLKKNTYINYQNIEEKLAIVRGR